MGAHAVANAFLGLLKKSKLLSSAQLDKFIRQHPFDEKASPAEIAGVLVADGLVTQFQADHLVGGRSRGFIVDHYKVLGVLGTGGMGRLFLAEDLQTGSEVALKKLAKRHETDAGMIARFRLEAKAGMALRHPNIVRTRELAQTEGIFGDLVYFVMDFVKGIGLEEMVAMNGPVDWPQACDIARQAAAALHHAHGQGMVHRDVKPANFLIDREGHVKILDFGLSLVRKGEDHDEFSLAMIFGHDCLGTADYIAPEQSLDSYQVDGRADVYSLGCTLYFALTGEVPFPTKRTADKVAAHRTKTARPLQELAPKIPDQVTAIVKKMMGRRPEQRFQNARQVYQALAPFAERRPVAFDFQSVLAQRVNEEEQRAALLRRQAQKTAAPAAAETRQPEGGSSSARRASTVDTMIREDTRANSEQS